jgi:outer membrane protein OmpA-like peptidoglycan-associated protein
MRAFATPTRKRPGARASALSGRLCFPPRHAALGIQRAEVRHILHGPRVQSSQRPCRGCDDDSQREWVEEAKQEMANDLVRIPPRPARAAPIIQREITEDSIRNGDFFSTNCGWVDAGHSNPADARTLIAQVREASQRIERREAQLRRTLAGEPAPTVTETTCDLSYDSGEETESQTEPPIMESTEHPSGAVDIVLGGFGVDSSAADKFGSLVALVAQTHAAWETLQGRRFQVQILGFSDCIGTDERNDRLRLERAGAIALELAGHGPQVNLEFSHGINDFVASNVSRAGRKKNRGVLIRFVPQVRPETFTTETAESRFAGVQVSAVTPTAALNRSLTEDEVLSVALTIFSAQSTAFEHLQQWRDVIPFSPPSSSFAEEDLPSNLIGFYRAARGFSFAEIRTLCDAWDEARSIAHLSGYTFQRNRSFSPVSLPPGGTWPAEFQTITPASFESQAFQILNLRLSTPLITINCSIDPRTNTLRCP